MEKIFKTISTILAFLIPTLKKPESKESIKETKEVVIMANEIAVLCCERFADGVQMNDFETFYSKLTSDEEFKAKIKNGYEGVKLIPAEMKDIDVGEGLELAQVQIEYVPKYINAFSKKKPEISE